jgi:hypothetical protein
VIDLSPVCAAHRGGSFLSAQQLHCRRESCCHCAVSYSFSCYCFSPLLFALTTFLFFSIAHSHFLFFISFFPLTLLSSPFLTNSSLPPHYLLITSSLPPHYLLITSSLPPHYLLTTSSLYYHRCYGRDRSVNITSISLPYFVFLMLIWGPLI